jgi:hypothetical protein
LQAGAGTAASNERKEVSNIKRGIMTLDLAQFAAEKGVK